MSGLHKYVRTFFVAKKQCSSRDAVHITKETKGNRNRTSECELLFQVRVVRILLLGIKVAKHVDEIPGSVVIKSPPGLPVAVNHAGTEFRAPR